MRPNPRTLSSLSLIAMLVAHFPDYCILNYKNLVILYLTEWRSVLVEMILVKQVKDELHIETVIQSFRKWRYNSSLL
jgi:hypothetical protein